MGLLIKKRKQGPTTISEDEDDVRDERCLRSVMNDIVVYSSHQS